MGSHKLIIKSVGFVLFLFCFATGCAPNTLFQWGDYEKFLYKRFNKPGSLTTQEEIISIENHLEQTYAKQLFPPPGLHAHLGYLYISEGKRDRALEHFIAEKKQFPESTHFINGIIERMKQ
jgi:hypothetical protein